MTVQIGRIKASAGDIIFLIVGSFFIILGTTNMIVNAPYYDALSRQIQWYSIGDFASWFFSLFTVTIWSCMIGAGIWWKLHFASLDR